MKNIHVLPTDKPSRLHFDGQLFLSPNLQLSKSINSIVEGRNPYITSDEEIKEGDAYITKYGGICKKHNGSKILLFKTDKKIILTTDPDLIADGVQEINDEFLEWFVKNPNCEYVSIDTHSVVKEDGIQELMKDEFYQNFPEELPNCVFINHYKTINYKVKEDVNLLKKILYKSNLDHCGSAEDMQYALEEINDLIKKHHPNLEEDSE
jgi:5S rRNA maturation endonuclease (ribonuclease M5)